MNFSAKVSVVMCTYNGARFIEEQIASIAQQTYPIYELIIQDDCSTDDTDIIVECCKKRYPNCPISFLRNEKQLGYTRNFLTAYLKAGGDYIASCDQDDIWNPRKIEILMQNIGEKGMIFHRSIMFDETQPKKGFRPVSMPNLSPLYILLRPQIAGHQQLFSSQLLPYIQEILKTQSVTYDYLTCTLAACMKGVGYVEEDLVRWRRYEGATTYVTQGEKGKIVGYLQAIQALFDSTRRKETYIYFSLYLSFPFEKEASWVVSQMSKGSISSILRVCFRCLALRKMLYPKVSGIAQMARAFFMPLFFIRDYGRFILKK